MLHADDPPVRASTSRTASPASSSRPTMRVMLGGCTCSTAGELAQGDRPEPLDGGERGEAGRGEVVARAQGLLAHAAGEPGVGQPQARRQLGAVGVPGSVERSARRRHAR